MTKFEISTRSKQIDLLRNNLNLLQSEFNNQIERNSGQTASKSKQKGKRKEKEFVDLFAINGSADNIELEQDERALTGAERNLLKEFEENDQELEALALEIVNALDNVKHTAEAINSEIGKQGNMLREQRLRAERNKNDLESQNNDLKKVIEKHKSGK